jgi:hypothetical protein
MAPGEKHLKALRRRIPDLLNAKRSHMCWELGHFQAPMFIQERGESPTKPHMLVCIDTASRAIMGNDLLRDPPSPQDLLSVLVVSMEKPGMVTGVPVLPESVRLDDSAVFELVGRELGQLGLKVELVKRLSALQEFKGIAERDFFSHHIGYSGGEN